MDACAPRSRAVPLLESSVRELILRLAEENGHWGYKRIVGELKGLGIVVSATSVRKVLLEDGLQPAPQWSRSSWRAFLRAHAATKFSHAFDEVFLLDRVLIFGRRHLEHVLRDYRRHYNEHRPHRALDLTPPDGRDATPLDPPTHLRRHDLLGGFIHEYEAA